MNMACWVMLCGTDWESYPQKGFQIRTRVEAEASRARIQRGKQKQQYPSSWVRMTCPGPAGGVLGPGLSGAAQGQQEVSSGRVKVSWAENSLSKYL